MCRDLVRPEGLICLIVPNDYNPLQKILREEMGFSPWWLAPPHHINYFSFDSLTRIVVRAGFEVIHKTATFPMELFLLMGDNYVGNDEMGRAMHARRKRLELVLDKGRYSDIKELMYQAMADREVGREAVVYARRPA
jgi:hypothetical protein